MHTREGFINSDKWDVNGAHTKEMHELTILSQEFNETGLVSPVALKTSVPSLEYHQRGACCHRHVHPSIILTCPQ